MIYLLALSIGPVQEFIKAARRTRDLWFGSYLISEISKAAARAVQERGGELIFPASDSEQELAPDSNLNVANVILARVETDAPQNVADAAEVAAQGRWAEIAGTVFQSLRTQLDAELWQKQEKDVLEFFAAWVQDDEPYAEARQSVMRLLGARKLCRDFQPSRVQEGRPKSSLDGLRESVLLQPEELRGPQRRRLRLRKGEQLDIVGVVKRTALNEARFPSVSRIAADPWLRGIDGCQGARALATLIEECQRLGGDVVHRLDTSSERGQTQFASFPFEGTAVFRSRHHELVEETDLDDGALAALGNAVQSLSRVFGEPNPYVACLVADGDRIGEYLSRLDSVTAHRKFSRRLAGFAAKARQTVQEHSGVLVYSGGDDVLAFLPVDRCLDCARQLHDQFEQQLEESGTGPTLSVGVAIAHFLDNLEDLLEFGRAAERHAKTPDRDGLAVHLHKRGGGPIRVRGAWKSGPDRRFLQLANWINQRAISGRVAYDLRRIATAYDGWTESPSQAMQRDALSVLQGKQPRGQSEIKSIAEFVRSVRTADDLCTLSDELLVARQIAVALRQASSQTQTAEVIQ